MRAKRRGNHKPSGSGAKLKSTWPYFEVISVLDPSLESRSTSGNVAFEQQEVLLYTDHAEYMSEEITPDIPYSLDASIQSECLDASIQSGCLDSSVEKELETPKRNFKRKQTTEKAQDDIDREYLEELKRINASRVDETDPDRMFLLSMLPYLKNLSPAENFDFKFQMFELLKNKMNFNK
ncbi:uncharacterized protein TNCT_676131 [Trichonephila clavata]|uniref:BESS domain-containing protein n=1 Tax=Trichonephila clavata TaxID=2740835 RepID=A0A8X6FKC8_TRICU|nr:uncharacterized protein TNCT_676131 [Trichonephila clavata]